MSSSQDETDDLLSTILNHVDERLGSEDLSLSQCLRKLFSTKQRPSRLVQQLLPEANIAVIQENYKVILEHMSKVSTDLPCLLSIKVVSTVLFFLQLVLESMSKIGEQECMQMAMALIQSLQKAICAVLQNSPSEHVEDVVPRNVQHAPTLGAFCIGALLRALNPYVSSIPVLLSPLWKTLCDVLTKSPNVPYDLAKASMLALLVYLKEGERPCLRSAASFASNPQQQQSNLQQHVFHAKVLGFLIARLTTLLPVYVHSSDGEEEENSVISDVFDVLIRIRGLSKAVEVSTTTAPLLILQSYKSVEKKVDQCLLRALMIKKDTLEHATLKTLLSVKTSSKPSFESRCSRLGKLALLQVVLQQTPIASINTESLILVAEQAIFSTMPKCSSEMLVGGKCVMDSFILSTTVRATIYLDATKGLQVRQMLLKWLSRRLHPISREAVVTIVHNYIVALGRIFEKVESPRSSLNIDSLRRGEPMMTLLAQVLFDHRTTTCHRENMASVFHRLLASKDCQGAAQAVLLPEIVVFLKKLRIGSRKRKRTETDNMSTLADWTCMLDVAATLDYSSNEALQREVSSLMDELVSRDDSSKTSGIFHLGRRTPLEFALIWAGAQQQPAIKLTGWFLTQTQRRKRGTLLTRNGTLLTYAVLQYLGRSFQESPETSTVVPVAKILTWTLEQAKQLLSSHKEDCGVVLALATGSVLRRISHAISPSTSSEVIQQIASCFHSLFKLGLWTISANTMTCLTEFASTIPKSHQGVLTKCLPVEMQALFTCRLQGKVHRSKTVHSESDFEQVQSACAQRLTKLIPSVPGKESPFATSLAYILAPGSFFLSMPTVENSGRSALVVFPPGDQSLQDIKHMLQKDTIEREDVRRLHQVRLSDNGSGCRLYSVKYS